MKTAIIQMEIDENIDIDWKATLEACLEELDGVFAAEVKSFE